MPDPYTTLRKILDREVKIFENPFILDIGTGYGHGLKIILEVLSNKKNSSIYCIDSSSDSIEWLKRNFDKNGYRIYFKNALAENLPFTNNFFDIVILSLVLHHIKDVEKALDEALRVVKEGGYVNIVDWTPESRMHEEFILKESMNKVLFFLEKTKYRKTFGKMGNHYYAVIRKLV